jgi:hypothetical protein
LQELGLQPVDKKGRPWSVRCQGALKLLKLQILFVGAQLLVMLSNLFLVPWLFFIP